MYQLFYEKKKELFKVSGVLCFLKGACFVCVCVCMAEVFKWGGGEMENNNNNKNN